MIILEGQILRTRTHYTKHKMKIINEMKIDKMRKKRKKKRKKLVEKERQRKKSKYASIKQRKARKNIVLINLQLIFINMN